jgi:hypothetical protein
MGDVKAMRIVVLRDDGDCTPYLRSEVLYMFQAIDLPAHQILCVCVRWWLCLQSSSLLLKVVRGCLVRCLLLNTLLW